jgi:hypothetical protein
VDEDGLDDGEVDAPEIVGGVTGFVDGTAEIVFVVTAVDVADDRDDSDDGGEDEVVSAPAGCADPRGWPLCRANDVPAADATRTPASTHNTADRRRRCERRARAAASAAARRPRRTCACHSASADRALRGLDRLVPRLLVRISILAGHPPAAAR